MELAETEIRSRLLDESEEFRSLAEKHEAFEERLDELTRRRPISEQERLEQVELKKRKLLLKDRMAAMIRSYQREGAAVTL